MANNGNDKAAVNEALQALPHATRTKIIQESLEAALDKLPGEQSQQVISLARELAEKTNKMGASTAIEVLAAIGMLWSENGHGK